MDNWDSISHRIKQAMVAEEPEAALAGLLDFGVSFGRVLETISADTDRIATALEKIMTAEPEEDEDLTPPPELAETPQSGIEHDL